MPNIIEKELGLTKLLQKQIDAFLGHSVHKTVRVFACVYVCPLITREWDG